MLFTLAHAKSNKPAFDSNGKPLLNPEAERLYAKAMEMLKPSPQMMHSLYGSMGMARHKVEMFEDAIKYYERYLKLGKPGTAGYQFVEESIQYVKHENVPHLHKKKTGGAHNFSTTRLHPSEIRTSNLIHDQPSQVADGDEC